MDDPMIAILKKRAQRYASPPKRRKEEPSLGTFVGCRTGDLVLALPSQLVVECSALSHWTPLSGRRNLLGITHLRGDVMALFDLHQAITGKPSGKCGSMAILQAGGGRFAVSVQEVLGIRTVESGELLSIDQIPMSSDFVFGTTRDLWFLIKEESLLGMAE